MSQIDGTTINSGIVLGTVASTGTYTSPLTITSTGVVAASSGDAIYGDNSAAWTVVNSGTVGSTGGAGSEGIDLRAGGNVDNTASGLIKGYLGVYIGTAAGTVTNAGTIDSTAASSYGVRLNAGGSIDNTGLIEGFYGVQISGTAGTVTNSGRILGAYYGVRLNAGGSVDNTGTGLIKGDYGVQIGGTAGTVTNSGTIRTSGYRSVEDGVRLTAGGSVDNTGLIEGATGVYIKGAAGTVSNAGTISGTGGTAVIFGGTGGNLLVLDPGYVLNGKVIGSTAGGATNTLELGSAASAGTVSGIGGSSFGNFGTVTVDSGARWSFNSSDAIGVGVSLFNDGTISNTVRLTGGYLYNRSDGRISGSPYGVRGYKEGVHASVVNAGTINGNYGVGFYYGGGDVTNLTGALISGGVYLSETGTVVNAGTMVGALNLHTGGYVSNAASGLIRSDYDGVSIQGAVGTLVNAGTIDTGSPSDIGDIGVGFAQGGYVGNSAGGLITGYAHGVQLGGGGTVVNAGTILATGTGASGYNGVRLGAGGTVVELGDDHRRQWHRGLVWRHRRQPAAARTRLCARRRGAWQHRRRRHQHAGTRLGGVGRDAERAGQQLCQFRHGDGRQRRAVDARRQ